MVTKRSVRIGSACAALVIALAIVYQWRGPPDRAPSEASAGPADSAATAREEPDRGSRATQELRSPSEPSSTAASAGETTDDAPEDPLPLDELRELVEGIDPLLGQSNMIVRAPDPGHSGPGLVDVESQFRTESADPDWSGQMESRILDQVARLGELSLVTLEAECRETICRLKLFYPPGTNALSTVDRLKPLATELGFSHVVAAATLEENGVSMSLLYLQHESE